MTAILRTLREARAAGMNADWWMIIAGGAMVAAVICMIDAIVSFVL